jgi:transposase-like protein
MGRQKSKRLSYTAKFKCEVIRCAEKKGNRKAAAIFGVHESNVRLWRKHKAATSGCEAFRRKFTGPKKGRFPEIDDAVFTFFQERRKNGLFLSYELLREEAIKKARSLNIRKSCFKASKGWAIRFMRRMGLALRRRSTVCQKKCSISNASDGFEDVIVWVDDIEDKDDSDHVESKDNDLAVSDDCESDE